MREQEEKIFSKYSVYTFHQPFNEFRVFISKIKLIFFSIFFLLYPYSNQSQFIGYQGWDEILMISLISSKKLGVYKIVRKHCVSTNKSTLGTYCHYWIFKTFSSCKIYKY